MIFNLSKNHKFSTRLQIGGEILEIVNEAKLLGTTISNDLKWDKNTQELVKKANKRMEIIRKISNFGASIEDLRTIYVAYVRSILEQSCTVWHSSLTEENSKDIERVQKSACKLILAENYKTYENALKTLDIESLYDRRERLCLEFARKCLGNEKMKKLFKENPKLHEMETRNKEKYEITYAKTSRFKKSPIIYMQRLLNMNINMK